MAELGVIQHQNVNAGTRQIDRSAELRALTQGLNLGKTILDENIKGNVTEDMLTALDEAIEASSVTPVADGGPIWKEGSQELYMSNRIDKLQHVIAQGKASQVTKAQTEIKSILAKAQTSYPWLYDDLQRRASQVIAGSHQMQQLGLDDELRGEAADTAAEQLDAIVKQGRAKWSEGGYAIPAHLQPSDPYFQRLYLHRMEQKEAQNAAEIKLSLMATKGNLTAEDWNSFFKERLYGPAGLFTTQIDGLELDNDVSTFYAEISKASPDQAYIENFKNVNVDQIIRGLQGFKVQATANRANIPADVLNSDRFKVSGGALYDSSLKQVDDLIQMWKDVQSNVEGAEIRLKNAAALRMNTRIMNSPEGVQAFNDVLMSPNGPDIVSWAVSHPDVDMFKIKGGMADWARTALGSTFPEMNDGTLEAAVVFNAGTTAMRIPPSADADTIIKAMNNQLQDDENSWFIPTSDEDSQKVAALHSMDTFHRLVKRAKAVTDLSSPTFASQALQGLSYSLAYVNGRDDATDEVKENILPMLADPDIMEAVKKSQQDFNIGQRHAFATLAEEYYVGTRFDHRRQAAINTYRNTKFYGQPLSELAVLDVESLEDGEMKWVFKDSVLDAAAKRKAQALAYNTPSNQPPTSSQLATARNRVQVEADKVLRKISQEVKQQIAIERMLNQAYALDALSVPKEDTFSTFFLGNGPVGSGSSTAWVNGFNYTEEGTLQ